MKQVFTMKKLITMSGQPAGSTPRLLKKITGLGNFLVSPKYTVITRSFIFGVYGLMCAFAKIAFKIMLIVLNYRSLCKYIDYSYGILTFALMFMSVINFLCAEFEMKQPEISEEKSESNSTQLESSDQNKQPESKTADVSEKQPEERRKPPKPVKSDTKGLSEDLSRIKFDEKMKPDKRSKQERQGTESLSRRAATSCFFARYQESVLASIEASSSLK